MTDDELPCRIEPCGFTGSSPASLRSHVTGKTDDAHREAAEDHAWIEWYPEAFGIDGSADGGSKTSTEGTDEGSPPEGEGDEYAAQYEPPTEGDESGDSDGGSDPPADPSEGGSGGGWTDLLWLVVPLVALLALLAGGSDGTGGGSDTSPGLSQSGSVTPDDTATPSTGVPTIE